MEPLNDPLVPEEPLTGDLVSSVSRVGDTVRRSTGPWTPAVHALLRHLEGAGFDGAPRALGMDERGREVLSFVPGEVPEHAGPDTATERALAGVSRLLRRYHDAVRRFELPPDLRWHHRPLPGPETVICHNDLSPRNTVFCGGRPVAFLDWDLAAPAPPAWDVAHAAWQFVPLADDEHCARQGWPTPPDRARRLRILCDGYRLSDADRIGFTGLVIRRIEELAAAGMEAHERLVRTGIPSLVRVHKAWVERHASGASR